MMTDFGRVDGVVEECVYKRYVRSRCRGNSPMLGLYQIIFFSLCHMMRSGIRRLWRYALPWISKVSVASH
jgi:hypothetical protein